MGTIRIKDWEEEVLEKIEKGMDQVDSMSDALNEVLSWYGFQHWCVHQGDKDIPNDYWEEYRSMSGEEKKELLNKLHKKVLKFMDKIKSEIAKGEDESN